MGVPKQLFHIIKTPELAAGWPAGRAWHHLVHWLPKAGVSAPVLQGGLWLRARQGSVRPAEAPPIESHFDEGLNSPLSLRLDPPKSVLPPAFG